MAVLRVLYKAGKRFDEQYYRSKHVPLAGAILGPHGITSVEFVRFTKAIDGSQPSHSHMLTAHFASDEALASALKDPRLPELIADSKNYYEGTPEFVIGEIVQL